MILEKIKVFSKYFLFFALFILPFREFAQAYISEFENYDCTYSKEIIIPFNYTKNGEELKKPPLNQTVFYTHRDQFSYWYKVIAKEDAIIGFKVDPIDNRDSYVIFVYQYNKNDFCDKVYNQKIQPEKSSFFLNNKQSDEYDLTQKSMQIKKDNIYYISILNTSINNCGHFFRLWKGKDTVKIKSIHIPCVRDVSIASKKVELNFSSNAELEIKKDTIQKSISKTPSVQLVSVKCKVISSKKAKLTEPKLKIVDELTGNEITVNSTNNEDFEFKIERGKNYKVECSAVGFKHFDHSLNISNEIKGSDNCFEIKLDPLKTGDNFIMKNIYFHPNTYALRKESEQYLSKLLSYLLANESVKIEIQGHTNGNNHIYKNKAYMNMGDEWNFSGSAKKLSKKRAENIKKYLVSNGVNEKRLIAKGYGGDRMIIQNPTTLEEGQQNIRVEIVILEN